MTNYKPNGIIEITGEHDAGKTLAALFVNYEHGYNLKDIAFFHDDVKEPGYPPKAFGLYVDLVNECRGLTLFEFREYVLDKINTIKEGQFKVIVFDTWHHFGESLQNYVHSKAKSNEFRTTAETIMRHEAKVIGAQIWRDAYNYEASIVAQIKSLCDVMIVTSHLKDGYVANVKVGKVDQLSARVWGRICNMRLWLRHNPASQVPIGLVLKRPHKPSVENGKPVSISILPRRFEPQSDHNSIWDTINHYYQNPIGNREPLPNEIPTEFELSILDGILTPDQKETWKAELYAKKEQDKQERALLDMQLGKVKKAASGITSPAPLAFKTLKKQFPDENFSMQDVERWRNE